jgi:hypothetical protein
MLCPARSRLRVDRAHVEPGFGLESSSGLVASNAIPLCANGRAIDQRLDRGAASRG